MQGGLLRNLIDPANPFLHGGFAGPVPIALHAAA
jgi:hypothetical protein